MEKSHKIYNLIFDFLLAAGVCFYNDLRFMRVWFLGGQLYHSVGFANYRFGLTGKEVCWDFSPLNILHCLQGYDPHAYLKFLCFFCIGILMFFRFVFRAPKLLPRLFARLFCFSAGYIAVVELYNLLFTAAGAVFLDISNWFLYLTGAWSAIAILTLLLVASKKFRPAPLPSRTLQAAPGCPRPASFRAHPAFPQRRAPRQTRCPHPGPAACWSRRERRFAHAGRS